MKISPVCGRNIIQNKALGLAGISVGTAVALQNKSDNQEKNIKREIPFYMDVAGLFHKKTTEIKISANRQNRTLTESDITGSKLVRNFIFDEKMRPVERICKKYTKEGVIDFETRYKTSYENGVPTTKIINRDFRINTETNITTVNNQFEKEVIKHTNPKNGKVSFEIIEKSPVKGVLNSKIIDENGNEKIESIAYKTKDGVTVVKKDFESFDGTKTKYFYKNFNNNSELHYQILSKDGKPLMTLDRVSKQINSNQKFSSLNGHGYMTTFDEKGFEIDDLVTKEKKYIKYSEITDDEASVDFIKTLPADILLKTHERKIKITACETPERKSTFYSETNSIKTYPNVYTLAHELGHALDYSVQSEKLENASLNPKLRQEYEKEKIAFKNNLSDIPQDYISYFLMETAGGRGVDAGVNESVAESHALLSELPDEIYSQRAHYFQKYFPNTIAQVSKLFLKNNISC